MLKPLTYIQNSILTRLAEGASIKAIASERRISVKTVEYHRTAIWVNLGIDNLADLTRYAVFYGLVENCDPVFGKIRPGAVDQKSKIKNLK